MVPLSGTTARRSYRAAASRDRIEDRSRGRRKTRVATARPDGHARLLPPTRLTQAAAFDDEGFYRIGDLGASTKTHILNLLHRLIDGKPTDAPAVKPNALTLTTEPQSNVERYDALRKVREARHAS
jgi:hypothetical protein